MKTGRIIKTYSGFYYVYCDERLYTCKARGLFKKNGLKPLVGDIAEIEELEDKEVNGNIVNILPRKSELQRPSVANIDLALVVFSATVPKPKFSALDKCLIEFQRDNIDTVICFNKSDTASFDELESLKEIYLGSGYKTLFTSAVNGYGFDELKELLNGKITVFTGPSGVGKSSLINALSGHSMDTGALSAKTSRGKQTTRHYELVMINSDTMLLDSPGFTSLRLNGADYYDLKDNYREFVELSVKCKYKNKCLHINEPDCMVKEAVSKGKLSSVRYRAYMELMDEIKDKR